MPCQRAYRKKVTMFGIMVTKMVNLANSAPPHARSRYFPPNHTTAPEIPRLTTLFSMRALVRNVHGNLIDLVGTKTRYGTAHCGEEKTTDGAVACCSWALVAELQVRKRRKAFKVLRARRVRRRPRVRGGRLRRGGMVTGWVVLSYHR